MIANVSLIVNALRINSHTLVEFLAMKYTLTSQHYMYGCFDLCSRLTLIATVLRWSDMQYEELGASFLDYQLVLVHVDSSCIWHINNITFLNNLYLSSVLYTFLGVLYISSVLHLVYCIFLNNLFPSSVLYSLYMVYCTFFIVCIY